MSFPQDLRFFSRFLSFDLEVFMSCDWKIWCVFKFKQIDYSKRYFAINPPKNIPFHFKHIYPLIFLPLFKSSCKSPFSYLLFAVLTVSVSWINLKIFTPPDHFDLWEEPEVTLCQIQWLKQASIYHNVWACLLDNILQGHLLFIILFLKSHLIIASESGKKDDILIIF